MKTFKTMSIGALVLGLSLLAAGVLYSAGNDRTPTQTQVQLPENKMGEFELRTVYDGKACVCYFPESSNPKTAFGGQQFHTAERCEEKCQSVCEKKYPDKVVEGVCN